MRWGSPDTAMRKGEVVWLTLASAEALAKRSTSKMPCCDFMLGDMGFCGDGKRKSLCKLLLSGGVVVVVVDGWFVLFIVEMS